MASWQQILCPPCWERMQACADGAGLFEACATCAPLVDNAVSAAEAGDRERYPMMAELLQAPFRHERAPALPVSWARRRALDAVMAWVREREKRGTPTGPEREYVNGHTGVTEITGGGKVYATEAVDRMEALLVDLGVPEMLALLREVAERTPCDFPDVECACPSRRARALLARLPKEGGG